MVDIHYFLFIINGDTALFGVGVFIISYIALRLVFRMWRRTLRCPHCGQVYRTQPVAHLPEKNLPNTLWT